MARFTAAEARKLGIPVPEPSGGRKRARKKEQAIAREVFDQLCEWHGLPRPVYEFQFHPDRKWRFDYLFEGWLAVERVGGVWSSGHHSRGQSQIDDMERRNEAQLAGYMVLEFTPGQFEDGSAFPVILRALKGRTP